MMNQTLYIFAIIGSLMVVNELCSAEEIGQSWRENDDNKENLNEEEQQVDNDERIANDENEEDDEDDENDENDEIHVNDNNNHNEDHQSEEDVDNGDYNQDDLINLDAGDEEDELRRVDEQAVDDGHDEQIEASDFAKSPDTFEEETDYHDEDGMKVGFTDA